jgi:protein involved in polysaccharide export with SLBB domain
MAAQVEPDHLINVGDAVELRFNYRPDFNQTLTVRDDGRIDAALIGPVGAAGRPPELVAAELKDRYGRISYNPLAARTRLPERQYYVNFGDTLEIKFESESDYDDTVTVRPDGKISLALVKTVVAEGKTPEEIERELTERYARFLREPKLVVIVRHATSDIVYVQGKPVRMGLKDLDGLSVSVRRSAQRLIYVTGEVGRPGFIPYQPPMTLMRAIIAAGGAKRTGRMSSVVILRKLGPTKPAALVVDLRPEQRGEATTDVPLLPNDVVIRSRYTTTLRTSRPARSIRQRPTCRTCGPSATAAISSSDPGACPGVDPPPGRPRRRRRRRPPPRRAWAKDSCQSPTWRLPSPSMPADELELPRSIPGTVRRRGMPDFGRAEVHQTEWILARLKSGLPRWVFCGKDPNSHDRAVMPVTPARAGGLFRSAPPATGSAAIRGGTARARARPARRGTAPAAPAPSPSSGSCSG